MKLKTIFCVALCLVTMATEAQVVYGENEKDYVKTTASVVFQDHNRELKQETPITNGNSRFRLSAIGDNWFLAIKGGASLFLGVPKGCGDVFGKTKPTMAFSVGKWHSPFFGTRLVYQGFKFANSDSESTAYQNLHGDLMLNISSFHRTTYTPLPRWNVVPYIGAGVIRNTDLKRNPFAVSYGLLCNYRVSQRLNVTAELGGTSTFQTFDGKGKDGHFGDGLFSASIGMTVNIGKLGWSEKKLQMPSEQLEKQEIYDLTPYPRNDYEGLRRLKERMNSAPETETKEELAQIDAPILFFFKINSTELVDKQQKVNINEIAGAVKEFDLHVKIIGAADSKTGTPKHNRKLSVRRAKYIAKLLYKAGVSKERMTGASQGGINIYKPYTANRHTCVILYKAQ